MVFFRSYQSDEHEKIPPEINCDHINARDFFIPTQVILALFLTYVCLYIT